jgi:tripartite-type tricarboxylate transporter receptor subunit TctC
MGSRVRFSPCSLFAVLALLFAATATSFSPIAYAQTYPARPIRIVTSETGGGADFQARLIAQGISASLGQQVIVDNRPGGVIPGDTVAKAAADGYTILYNGSAHWLLPFLRSNVPYDPVRDFTPIALAVRAPNVLVVHPSLPVKSVTDLIALAKARPGELNYGAGAPGSTSHLAPELFKAMAHVEIVRIPYKGTGPALNDLLGGQIQLMFPNAASVMPHMRTGRLRALAVSSTSPSPLAPGLPTVAASGLPGYESVSILGFFAPAKTPAAIVQRLNQEIVRYLHTGDAKERFLKGGVEATGSSPEELADTVRSEMARLGKLIQDVGIRAE